MLDGIFANMKAKLLLKSKEVLLDGAILEMVIWLLPEPVPGCAHGYKTGSITVRTGRDWWVSTMNDRKAITPIWMVRKRLTHLRTLTD